MPLKILDTKSSISEPITQAQQVTNFINGCSLLVVIVSFRTDKLVIETLKSLVFELSKQPSMRVTVVDNTCGEDAKSILAAIREASWEDWVMVLVSSRNGGFSYGNNLAIRHALKAKSKPQYVWLLNPDTQVCPGASGALVDFFQKHNDVGITGSCLLNQDATEEGIAFRFPTILGEVAHTLSFGPITKLLKKHVVANKMEGDQPHKVDWVSGASMMIRIDVFEESHLFDENYFLYYEETDFCYNALLAGWSSWYIPTSKVIHIGGQSTGITCIDGLSKRLPQYMFDSRSRYFVKNHGLIYATVADLARIIGLVCHNIIQIFRTKQNNHRTYLLRDSIRNFIIFKSFISFYNSQKPED